jgi:hypothetical protein
VTPDATHVEEPEEITSKTNCEVELVPLVQVCEVVS